MQLGRWELLASHVGSGTQRGIGGHRRAGKNKKALSQGVVVGKGKGDKGLGGGVGVSVVFRIEKKLTMTYRGKRRWGLSLGWEVGEKT